MRRNITTAALAGIAGAALTLAGCSGDVTDPEITPASTGPQIGQNALALDDGYVEAKRAADAKGGTDSTAIYGTLHNTTKQDLEITGFGSSLGNAPTYEFHEVDGGQMRVMDGEIIIPAGGDLELSADGLHLMIVGYEPELSKGSTIDVNFDVEPQQSVVISGVEVR